jgi:hypothetical protein
VEGLLHVPTSRPPTSLLARGSETILLVEDDPSVREALDAASVDWRYGGCAADGCRCHARRHAPPCAALRRDSHAAVTCLTRCSVRE